jgi:hypothetical protein
MMTNIQEFAVTNRLKARRSVDDDNELVVTGRMGQIYQYSENELGVLFMPPGTNSDRYGRWCPRTWNRLRKLAVNAGMILRQNADSEGALSFDPKNAEQSKFAIQIAKARPKRVLSPEHREKLALSGKRFPTAPQEVSASKICG